MKKTSTASLTLPIIALAAALIYTMQTTLADSDLLTARYVLIVVVLISALWIILRRGGRLILGPAPDVISLVLAGGALLCVWLAAWWIMAAADRGLAEIAGPHPTPRLLDELDDSLLGIDLQSTAYELHIVWAVVLVPLAQALILWGVLFPEILRRSRSEKSGFVEKQGAASRAPTDSRAVWIAGLIAGIILALTAVQNVTVGYPLMLAPLEFRLVPILSLSPELPWGLVGLAGYVVVGVIAAWAVYFSRSAWAGYVVQAIFAYTSFALRDDLTREFAAKDLLDFSWLTGVILGVLGAAILLQAIRFRSLHAVGVSPSDAAAQAGSRRDQRIMWVVLLAGIAIMAVIDLSARAA